MNSLSNKLSIVLRGSICLLGLVSVGNFLAAPANAQQATARGAVTLIRPLVWLAKRTILIFFLALN